jgi:hypothetical protein
MTKQENIFFKPMHTNYYHTLHWQEFLKIEVQSQIRIIKLDCSDVQFTSILEEIISKILENNNIYIVELDITCPCTTMFQYKRIENITESYISKDTINQIHKTNATRINKVLFNRREAYNTIKNLDKDKKPIDDILENSHYIGWEYVFINKYLFKNRIKHVNFALCNNENIITAVIHQLTNFPNLQSIDFYSSGLNDKHIVLMEQLGILFMIKQIDIKKSNISNEFIIKIKKQLLN